MYQQTSGRKDSRSGNLKALNDFRDCKSSHEKHSNRFTRDSSPHLPHVGSPSGTGTMVYRPERETHSYSIHGILDVESPVPLSELGFFEVKKTNSADIVIRPLTSKQKSVGSRKIIVSNESATYSEHMDSLGAKVHIGFSKNPLEVEVSRLLLKSRHVLYVNIVEPLLRLVLASKGYVLLHAACLSANRNGYLISAPPDTGKTTTILKCMKNSNFSFLSDDMTVVDRSGILYAFPKPLTISAHTFGALSRVSSRKALSLKMRGYAHCRMGRKILRLLGRLSIVSILTINALAQYVVRPPKVKITEVMKHVKLGSPVGLRSMYFLTKGRSGVRPISTEEAVSRAVANSDDAFFFPPYDKIFPHLCIEGLPFNLLMARERQIIKEALSNCNCFVVMSDDHGWSTRICRAIRSD
mgnify:CR=1 FL=1